MDKYCAVSQKQPADYHLDHLNRTGVGRTQETELSDTNITFGSKHLYWNTALLLALSSLFVDLYKVWQGLAYSQEIKFVDMLLTTLYSVLCSASTHRCSCATSACALGWQTQVSMALDYIRYPRKNVMALHVLLCVFLSQIASLWFCQIDMRYSKKKKKGI